MVGWGVPGRGTADSDAGRAFRILVRRARLAGRALRRLSSVG